MTDALRQAAQPEQQAEPDILLGIKAECERIRESVCAQPEQQAGPFHVEHRTNAASDVCDQKGRVYATAAWGTDAADRANRICSLLNAQPSKEQTK